jgi:hypothetical protein
LSEKTCASSKSGRLNRTRTDPSNIATDVIKPAFCASGVSMGHKRPY